VLAEIPLHLPGGSDHMAIVLVHMAWQFGDSFFLLYFTQMCCKGPGPEYIKIARLLTLPDLLQDRASPYPESATIDQRRGELDVDNMDIIQREYTHISILKEGRTYLPKSAL